MTVAVMQPPQRKGNTEQILDAIGRGLQMAQAYYGIKTDTAKLDAYKLEQEKARNALDDERAGVLSTKEQADLIGKGAREVDPNDPNTPGAYRTKIRRDGQIVDAAYLVPRKAEPAAEYRDVKVSGPNGSEMLSLRKDQPIPAGYRPYEEPKQETPEQALARQERQARIDGERKAKFVPGLGYADTNDDAKKIKEALDAFQNVKANVSQMRSLRDKYGSEILDRDAVATGQNLATDTQLQMKTIYGLGQISKGDQEMLSRIVPDDPLSVDFTGKTYAKLRTLEQTAEQKLKTQLKNRGFPDKVVDAYIAHTNEVHRIPGMSDGGTAMAAPPSAGMIFVSNGKETLQIPASDLEAAKRDGYQPIAGGR
jgi:hypothetical protein